MILLLPLILFYIDIPLVFILISIYIRYMRQRAGIILLDGEEFIVRIFETDYYEIHLVYYFTGYLKNNNISSIIPEIFNNPYAQHIAEWKICSRNTQLSNINKVQQITGFTVEKLTIVREQELICKGMFTELW